jgi:8-amino-3,8-dideoxy-alpha-D-manno-octulosonate transaminase
MSTASLSPLAVDGGPKAFPKMRGRAEPKIGIEEFMSIARRFGFSPGALERIRGAISEADLPQGGTNLARYFCPNPPDPAGPKFEAAARELFGVKYALGVSSGTAALHCAYIAAGVGPGTEVIVPALGFYATGAAAVLCGGVPIFCDVDESLQMDPRKIEALITPRTVAVAPTHHWGSVADMEPILAIARRHNLKVIEDCAQSPGARYRGRYVGTIGDIGCFSISAYKIIGGGEGGLVITNDQRLYEHACQQAEGGGLWRPNRFAPPRYPGELFNGTNYRLSELESAVDIVQIGKLPDIVRRHHEVRMRVARQLRCFREIRPQKLNDVDGEIGYQLRFFPQTTELSQKIARALVAEGISAGARNEKSGPDWHQFCDMFPIVMKAAAPCGQSPWTDPRYLERGGRVEYRPEDCPVARDLYLRKVTVNLNQWYSPEDCDDIAAGINKVLAAYCTEDPTGAPWV